MREQPVYVTVFTISSKKSSVDLGECLETQLRPSTLTKINKEIGWYISFERVDL